ncbi:hypothetical protein LCGC14_0878900 [marine sediment metagenome]|uniref:Peptidase M6-like domain-containing protein n=1 Tax=marine sediment metagenome TaxID=412755 RepID=A0A0F9S9H7_9ZZZZ
MRKKQIKNKTTTITIIAILTVSSFGLLFTMFLSPAAAMPADLNTMGPFAMDATPEMIGEKEVAFRKRAAEGGSAIATGVSPIGEPVVVGENITISVSDMGLDIDYDETFVVVMDGVNGIILIEEDAYNNYDDTTDEYVFANPNDVWREEDRISTAQLTGLLAEFDNNIYETVTGVFGNLTDRGDEGQKVWILIHNIRDESYYDPKQTSYVAGYFSASENSLAFKNMFHIDSYDWQNRVGPDGGRPYLYEGVFAHEFQHMVHFDQDPNEPSWVDEGLADLAGYLSGYGHSSGHLAYYMVYHQDTSLTFWGGRLEDYGASYLFQLYLYEKFGGAAFISALVAEQDNGIKGIEDTLAARGFSETFDEIYDAWTIAVYFDDLALGSLYGFDTLDIGTDDTWGYSIRWVLDNIVSSGVTQAPGGWLSSAKPYTAQYYRFGAKKDDIPLLIYVEGETTSGPGPYSGEFSWASGVGAWSWRSISQTFNLTSYTDVTLDFYTYFEIEMDWDYGYVEVYDQNTEEWYTLDDPSVVMYDDDGLLVPMVDYIAHAQDNPNTDDGREPTAYNATGRWHAFSGNSGGWIPVSMDLTPFAGHVIDLYFTTWQDGAFTLQQMYVDNISITADGNPLYFDDVEDEAAEDWDTTPNFEGGGSWSISVAYAVNNWQATVIETFKEPTKRNPNGPNPSEPSPERELLSVQNISMYQDLTWWWFYGPTVQMGQLPVMATPVKNTESMVLILSNRKDHILPAGNLVFFYV